MNFSLFEPSTRTQMYGMAPSNFIIGKTEDQAKPYRKKKARKWRKPAGMPKRPLSAYNIFFAEERKELLKISEESAKAQEERGQPKSKIGFANLARSVAAKWKLLSDDEKKPFALKAVEEQKRYKLALDEWQRLGLDPRRKPKQKAPSSGAKQAVKAKQARPALALSVYAMPMPTPMPTPIPMQLANTDPSQQRDALMICGLAECTFGDALIGGEQKTVSDFDWLQPYPLNKPDRFSATKEKQKSSPQVEYNELSSRLFQKLNRELDEDQAGFLKTAFARSA